MLPGHLDGVMAIEEHSFPSPWTRTAFAGHLQHPEFAKYLVAMVDRKLVGYIGLFFGGGHGQITNFAVHPRWRQRKIGSLLLLAVIDFALNIGLVGLSLEVRVSNDAAQALYEKFGFTKVGKRKGYYQETGEDAFVMCLFNLNEPRFLERRAAIKDETGRYL